MKFLAIFHHKEKYPVKTMCGFFGVSRSGYYDFVKRMDQPDRDASLAAQIAQCQESCRKTYGYRRVAIWLDRNKGQHYNPKTVLRVMNKYGLLSEIRRRKYKVMNGMLHKYDNILDRDFRAERPNQKWVTDISYIHTGQGVLYLSMIRDLYDGSIIAHKTGTEQSTGLVLNTLKAARKTAATTEGILLHSDQGFQYTSHAYFILTKEHGISPSMSRSGNCYDNAMAENFFSILKTECIYRQKPVSFQQARLLIDDYIHFYNHERIQLQTKQTPLERRRLFAA